MCGIFGWVSEKPVPEKYIEQVSKWLEHRGPDGKGISKHQIHKQSVVFLHRRLSIIDLSENGKQPMTSACGQYEIIFNGEVYNFKEIRSKLIEKGYTFFSNTDTEVVLNAYIEFGEKSLHRFIGMFAFAILDKKKKEIFIARDRAGIKPLYYTLTRKNFVFASELKPIFKLPDENFSINKKILPYYFQFGYFPEPHTVFAEIRKLAPGHCLKYSLKTHAISIEKYWDVTDFYLQPAWELSEKEILQKTEELLVSSLNYRMIADVPVGVFLSGGYDSSLTAALLQHHRKENITTFTIGFKNPKYDESQHAKKIAKYLGTRHEEVICSEKEALEFVEQIPYYYDEPFGDSSAIPTMLVSSLARKKMTVAISSDGGDEVFLGYAKYFFLHKYQNKIGSPLLKTLLNFFSPGLIEIFNNFLPRKFKQRNIKDRFLKFRNAIGAKDFSEAFFLASSYVPPTVVKKILTLSYENLQSLTAWKIFPKISRLSFLNQMALMDYKTFMTDDVLVKVDRATMSVSLEGREPFLDHRIIEFIARVPVSIKYKNNTPKYLSRQILYKYIPKELADKPKSGFQVPLYEWLRKDLKPLVEKFISEEKLSEEIYNVPEVINLKEKFYGKNYVAPDKLWFVLMFEMWKNKHNINV